MPVPLALYSAFQDCKRHLIPFDLNLICICTFIIATENLDSHTDLGGFLSLLICLLFLIFFLRY